MLLNVLLIGKTGVGKTWVMQSLIKHYKAEKRLKIGKFYLHSNWQVGIVGKYDGDIFQGSDKLSMSVLTDLDLFLRLTKNLIIVAEGDRFTNRTYINATNPYIIKILGDGAEGRASRGSTQSDRHIKAISTRIDNINANLEVNNSDEALSKIIKLIGNELQK